MRTIDSFDFVAGRQAASCFHFDTLPERNSALDLRGLRLRIRIIPRGVRVRLAVHGQAVVTGRAFPAAHRVRGAGLEIVALDAVRREVVVAFDNDCLGLSAMTVSFQIARGMTVAP